MSKEGYSPLKDFPHGWVDLVPLAVRIVQSGLPSSVDHV